MFYRPFKQIFFVISMQVIWTKCEALRHRKGIKKWLWIEIYVIKSVI